MEKLRDMVKRKRGARSQEEVEREYGMGQRTISGIESGKTAVSRNIPGFVRFLGISTEEVETLMAHAAIELNKTERLPRGIRDKVNQIMGLTKVLDRSENLNHATITARSAPPMGNRDVPVYGRAHGGNDGMFEFNGEVIGWAERLPELEGVRDAYAVYVDGESMFPRYKVGETVWVNPTRPPARGDDVIVQLYPEREGDAPFGFIKEFRARTPTHLVVWQHNPPKEVKYPRESVKSVHYIAHMSR